MLCWSWAKCVVCSVADSHAWFYLGLAFRCLLVAVMVFQCRRHNLSVWVMAVLLHGLSFGNHTLLWLVCSRTCRNSALLFSYQTVGGWPVHLVDTGRVGVAGWFCSIPNLRRSCCC